MSRGAHLLELQDIESDLRAKLEQYRKIQRLLGESTPVRKARLAFEQAEAEEQAARARQQDINLEWQGVRTKVDSEEKLLYGGTVRNPKELTNLELEVEMLKKQQAKLEEQALALIEEVDQLAQVTASAKAAYETIEQESRTRQTDLEAKENQLKRYIAGRRKVRDEMIGTVDPVDLEQYRYVQKQKNDTRAVATLRDGVCSSCHIQVSQAKRETVERTSNLVTCGNCGRILVT